MPMWPHVISTNPKTRDGDTHDCVEEEEIREFLTVRHAVGAAGGVTT